jgi:hypothetical protein
VTLGTHPTRSIQPTFGDFEQLRITSTFADEPTLPRRWSEASTNLLDSYLSTHRRTNAFASLGKSNRSSQQR